ncbi:BCCT family transporter [Streptomyces sp. CB01881]|uniref:BCCT family transporter n=1 Tax=Streptomyces sp. CB01881 TaxID=2078691 RepID=UPI000CDCAA6D|nr:hypothetical protein C2142_07785 [Streptomyces sp. CB01881]TYC77352.1 hypothetical protein EH183_07795 [Streptomyces sp. CB01881]
MLRPLPGGPVTGVVAVLMVMTFFITSAGSASLVLGSLSHRGPLHPRPRPVAAALLPTGGLTAPQHATVLVVLPFVVVMLLLCVSLLKELRKDPAAGPSRLHPVHGLRDAVRVAVGEAMADAGARRGDRPPSE